MEGALVAAGPVIVAEQLPDSNASKAVALKFAQDYEKQFGIGSRTTLAGHSYDAYLLLEQVLLQALKGGAPGTPEFRAALRSAIETSKPLSVTNGVLHYSADDHWGFQPDDGVIMKVVNGDWKLE